MNTNRSRAAWWILGVSFFLGVAGNALVDGAWGLNVGLWTLLVVLCMFVVNKPTRGSGWFVVAVLLALALAWRDSPALNAINLGAALIALVFGAASARGASALSGFTHALWQGWAGISTWLGGWLGLIAVDVPWRSLLRQRDPKRWLGVARALAITVPLVVVFTALLTSADAVFARLVGGLFDWRLESGLWARLATVFVWFTLAAGLLRLRANGPQANPTHPLPQLGLLEIAMALGALNALFAAFIVVQFGYFFGGHSNVTALTGLTYAEYARRGSSELIQVVALTLPVLIAVLRLREPRATTVLVARVLVSITLGLLGVMLLSAWQRLELYRAAYGLTEIRFYTAAFIVWLGAMLVWFVWTALRDRYALFPRGSIVAAFVAVFIFNILNPSAMIVTANVARAMQGNEFDRYHALKLGADGVNALLENLERIPGASGLWQQDTRERARATNLEYGDWRGYNFAKARALQQLSLPPRP